MGSGSPRSANERDERADSREGNTISGKGRRAFAAPPPDPTEALYYEGMAAYQHRHWEEALNRFTRLKEVQPNRPGLDALLDEVRWFLQLEAAAPVGAGRGGVTPPVPATHADKAPKDGTQRSARWQTSKILFRGWGLMLLALVGITALALILLQGRLPWADSATRSAQELYNRGQARLAVGDYEGAQAAFKKLLDLSPNDPEGLLGLGRAERQQTLAQDYAAAEAAIAEENWELAAAELEKTLAIDSSYADAQAKADFVAQRRRLAGLYDDGSRLYDLGQWEQAIAQFEKIRELDNTYRAEAVNEFLFVSYLNAGQALIEQAGGTTTPIQRAIEYFSRALAVHPRNRPAADARRLAILYLEAVQGLAKGETDEAQSRLGVLLAESPTYANGQAATLLYTLLIEVAETTLKTGDIPGAIRSYQEAQAVSVSDHSAAIAGEAFARAITPTPTPRPTATPQPTPLPTTPAPLAILRAGHQRVNVRAGPSTAYPIIGQVGSDGPLAITARNADGSWVRICCIAASAEPGAQGWIATELVEIRGPLDAVAVSVPPPQAKVAPATSTPALSSGSSVTASQVICVAGQVRNVSGGVALAGWSIVLQTPAGATQTQQTDQNGGYRFSDLPAGTYSVREEMGAGWQAVSPQSDTITIGPSTACTVVDFWNERERSSGGGGAAPTPPR